MLSDVLLLYSIRRPLFCIPYVDLYYCTPCTINGDDDDGILLNRRILERLVCNFMIHVYIL